MKKKICKMCGIIHQDNFWSKDRMNKIRIASKELHDYEKKQKEEEENPESILFDDYKNGYLD